MFIGNVFVFPFILEKRPLQKVEGYVNQKAEPKKEKTDVFNPLMHNVPKWSDKF